MGPSLGSIDLPYCCEGIGDMNAFIFLLAHFVFRTSRLLWLFPKFGHILQNCKLNVSLKKNHHSGESVSIVFQEKHEHEGSIAKFTKQCMQYQYFLINYFFWNSGEWFTSTLIFL